MSVLPQIERLGDAGLLLRFGDGIDAAMNAAVHAAAARLSADRPAWLLDIVPAYATLGLFIDAAAFDAAVDPLAATEAWAIQALSTPHRHPGERRDPVPGSVRDGWALGPGVRRDDGVPRIIEILVDYGGIAGPDLAAVAAHAGLTTEDVIRRHTAPDYRVAMIGFSPGFPYLLGLDPALAIPRLATPRERVPAGSVAIGGAQTGLYPQDSPGGWRLIGRTTQLLFDPHRDPPTALQPGDIVRFIDGAAA